MLNVFPVTITPSRVQAENFGTEVSEDGKIL
jgi:hypothetical protein